MGSYQINEVYLPQLNYLCKPESLVKSGLNVKSWPIILLRFKERISSYSGR